MQAQTPSGFSNQDDLNKSVNKVLTGNVSPGNGLTFDPNGVPLTYSIDNMSGIILRIGSVGNPLGLAGAWIANNAALVITHNLNKVPYGFLVINKTQSCDVYWNPSVNPPTLTTITLYNTNVNADTAIYILV